MSFKSKTVVGPRKKNPLQVGNKALSCGRVTEKNNRLLRIADKKSVKDSKETKVIDDFIDAARIGDFKLVSRFIANGINVNVKDPYSRTPIYFAASNGHEDVVKLLLDYGADIKQKDTIKEWTPLHVAAASQTPQVVELLILSGADLKARDKGGRTPYHLSFLDHQTNTSRLISKYRSKTKVSEYPKIIAQQGNDAYLVQLSDTTAQVVDWDDKERFREFNLQSILARGYWEDITSPHPTLEELMAIEEVGD